LALPGSDVLPTSQSTQSEDPATSDFVLGPQSVHALLEVEPSFAFFLPAAQLLQSSELVTPFAEEYLPVTQLIQSL
jgi:hypothetical protein